MSSKTRHISPMLQNIRDFLIGRPTKDPNRFQHLLAERPGPEANLPPGPSSNLAANYYFTRDARREVMPNKTLADNSKEATDKLLASGAEAAPKQSFAKGATPGKLFLP